MRRYKIKISKEDLLMAPDLADQDGIIAFLCSKYLVKRNINIKKYMLSYKSFFDQFKFITREDDICGNVLITVGVKDV